jgi:beta-glucosidase
MAEALGDRVKHWVIFNEPAVFVLAAYIAGIHPPGLRDGALGMRASHIANLAQAAAFRVMKATGRANNVGTTLSMSSAFPASNSEQDRSAAERYHALTNVWFLEPLLKGTYPEPFLKPVDPGRIGVENGDMEKVRADLDFIGINLYTRAVVAHDEGEIQRGLREVRVQDASRTEMGWEVYPDSLYAMIKRIADDYPGKPIYVTENGCSYGDAPDEKGVVDDQRRIDYYRGYIGGVARAMAEGAPVKSYFAWTLMDNFEWTFGYSQRFGLVYVDHATQQRTIKNSGYWFRDLIANNGFD